MENSKIEWTDHTFNPWIGCTKVSPGCQHCYAEALAGRFGKAEWGPTAHRVQTSAANWRKPLGWARKAKATGKRARVFCASLADVFEDRHEVNGWRVSLLELIELTHSLDWLLLTKRPENVTRLIEQAAGRSVQSFFERNPHVWIGTSVENQEQADKRIPLLLDVPAPVRFLSCEPLLGPVDLVEWLSPDISHPSHGILVGDSRIDWVIVGGESGPHARWMLPDWVRQVQADCEDANVPFFFKQWGEWAPPAGGKWQFEPEMVRVGKKTAGRLLDGRTWDEVPNFVSYQEATP